MLKKKENSFIIQLALGEINFIMRKKKVNSNVFKFEFELQIHFNHIFLDIQNFSMT